MIQTVEFQFAIQFLNHFNPMHSFDWSFFLCECKFYCDLSWSHFRGEIILCLFLSLWLLKTSTNIKLKINLSGPDKSTTDKFSPGTTAVACKTIHRDFHNPDCSTSQVRICWTDHPKHELLYHQPTTTLHISIKLEISSCDNEFNLEKITENEKKNGINFRLNSWFKKNYKKKIRNFFRMWNVFRSAAGCLSDHFSS